MTLRQSHHEKREKGKTKTKVWETTARLPRAYSLLFFPSLIFLSHRGCLFALLLFLPFFAEAEVEEEFFPAF